MAVRASSPLTILFVAPLDRDGPAPHGLVGSARLMSDLLCSEVAACVAAVGHRMRVIPRTDRIASETGDHGGSGGSGWGSPPGDPPALVLWGLAPGETEVPDVAPGLPGLPALTVSLGRASAPPGVVCLPAESRRLCRILARAAPAGAEPAAPGRAAVLVHDGPGRDGDDHWPGLSWALTLLLGGPGRGVLVDAQGPGGSLSARLRTLAPTGAGGYVGWDSRHDLPVPGPALAARLPGAGGVRWWGWVSASPSSVSSASPSLPPGLNPWADPGDCLEVVQETFPWTVVDVGRDQNRARDWAGQGLPVLVCTDRSPGDGAGRNPSADLDPGADLPLPADVVLWTSPRARHGNRRRPVGVTGALGPVHVNAADWSGTSLASWNRSSRRGTARHLAAEIGLRLDHIRQASTEGIEGTLAGRIRR